MTDLVRSFLDGVSTGTFTTSSAGPGDVTATTVTGSPTIVTSTVRPPAIRFTGTALQNIKWSHTSGTSFGGSFRLRLASLPGAVMTLVAHVGSGSIRYRLQLLTTGEIRLVKVGGATVATSVAQLAAGVDYRVAWTAAVSAAGTVSATVYAGDTSTVVATVTGNDNYGAACDSLQVGLTVTVASGADYQLDDLVLNDAGTDPGPPVVTISGSAAWTEDDDAVAASATEAIPSSAAWLEEDDTVAASAAESIASTAAWTEADDTVAASAAESITGTAAWVEDDDTIAASATYTPPTGAATIAWTEDDDLLVAAAVETFNASLGWTEEDDVIVGVATATGVGPAVSYIFRPPTVGERARAGLPLTRSPRLDEGITVLRNGSSYTQHRSPTQDVLDAADAVYRGGYENPVTEAEAADLTAAGYGSYIFSV